MSEVTLPDTLQGNWIWDESSNQNQRESHVLFRRDFNLSEIPATAEIWIACHSFFNLYINEQHLSFGPSPSVHSNYYVQYFDITYLLQIGKNVISAQATNANISRFGNTRQAAGLWSQVNIDDNTTFATDKSWKVMSADHLLPNQFRISPSLGFVETQDLRKFTPTWLLLNQNQKLGQHEVKHNAWKDPIILDEINQSEILPQQLPEFISSRREFKFTSAKGKLFKERASICLEFSSIASIPGTYVAHTFFHADIAMPEKFFVHCDDSFKLFVNGVLINSQGDQKSLNGSDPAWHKPMTCLEGADNGSHCEGEIIEGWNSIIVITYCEINSPGVTVNFGSTPKEAINLVRYMAEESEPGWSMAGPLKIPFSHISGMLNFDQMLQTPYISDGPIDSSAYMMSLDFEPETVENEPVGFLEMKEEEYVILDAGKCLTGQPLLTLSGNAGDFLDIIYGEISKEGKLLALHSNHGRKVDSVILSEDELEWSPQTPRSFQYIGIHIRKAQDSVYIKNPEIRTVGVQDEIKGQFKCSDPILNQIYDISMSTLESCSQYNFVNSPAGDNCQYIADAAIQAMTSLQTIGTPDLSRKALIEFMLNQFETGEMPGACPSDIYFNIPDYPLHWVKWLQKHLLFTNDRALLETCLGGLNHLLEYYNSLAIPEHAVLGENLGELCFLDHDDIDRRGIVTGLNALYCRALHCAAWIYDYAGHDETALIMRKRAGAVAKTIRKLTWNEEKGLFADCYANGKRSTSYTMQTNILALYGALAEAGNYERVFDNVFFTEEPYFKLSTSNMLNPFFNYFILETAFSLNRRQWAVDFTKWYWGGMVEAGASNWWEFYNPLLNTAPTMNSSLCHGYGVSPNIYLFSDVAGIRPAAPGFEQVYFNPIPGATDSVTARIPTPHGYIGVDWKTNDEGGLDIEIKSSYALDVISELSPELAAVSTVHVSEEINIISDLE